MNENELIGLTTVATAATEDGDKLPGWAIGLFVVFIVLVVVGLGFGVYFGRV